MRSLPSSIIYQQLIGLSTAGTHLGGYYKTSCSWLEGFATACFGSAFTQLFHLSDEKLNGTGTSCFFWLVELMNKIKGTVGMWSRGDERNYEPLSFIELCTWFPWGLPPDKIIRLVTLMSRRGGPSKKLLQWTFKGVPKPSKSLTCFEVTLFCMLPALCCEKKSKISKQCLIMSKFSKDCI